MAAGQLTPAAQAFADRFGATADKVSGGTGFNRWALLVQLAVETAIGSQVFGNNPGNIECGPGVFCKFATLDDFAVAGSNLWRSTSFINNRYPNGVRTFPSCSRRPTHADSTARDRTVALGRRQLRRRDKRIRRLLAREHVAVRVRRDRGSCAPAAIKGLVFMASGSILLRGVDNALWSGNFDGTKWNFAQIGGVLGSPAIVPVHMPNGDIHAIVTGQTGSQLFESVSTNAGMSWSAPAPIGGAGDGVVGVSLPTATVDLSTVATAIANVKSDTVSIKAATDHSLKSS